MDPIDISTDRSEAEREAIIANRIRYAGISRLECIDCDDDIPQRRREAIPGCQRCIDCQEIHDRRHRR